LFCTIAWSHPGDDFWNDVADDDKLKSESKSFTGGNFASFTASPDDTRTNDDGKRDDVLEQKNNLNGASSASNSASKASSTAVKGDDDLVKSIKETGTKTDKLSNSNTVQVKKVHNIDANANNADDDLTTSKDDENTLSSFKGSGATTNGLSYSNGFQVQHDDANSKGANCCDTNVDGKSGTDDFQNDNFLDGNSGQSVGTLSAGEISSSGFAIGDDTSANFKAAGAGDAFAEGQSLDDEAVYSAPTATLSSPTPQPTVSKKASKKGKESSPTPAPSTKTVAADGTKSTSLDDFASGDDISGNFGTTSAVSNGLSYIPK